MKSYVLFGDAELGKIFDTAMHALARHVRTSDGLFYPPVNMDTGNLFATWVDSLGAFFPGLQVLQGDIKHALITHEVYNSIWLRYNAMPERWDIAQKTVRLSHYPLRPEFIESTYMLYTVCSLLLFEWFTCTGRQLNRTTIYTLGLELLRIWRKTQEWNVVTLR